MNKRQKKNKRRKIYKQIIEDVAIEISLNSKWREKIFNNPYNAKIEISYINLTEIPQYIQKDIILNKLTFSVEKVKRCIEYFDDHLEIFKFQSKEYPDIVRFSGNNPKIL